VELPEMLVLEAARLALVAVLLSSAAYAAGDGGGRSISVRVGNATRHAVLHLPPTETAAAPAALVLNWHGMMENPAEQQGLSNLDSVADAHGFVVVYPQGGARAKVLGHELPGYTHNGGGCCSSADTDGTRIDDVAFARALVAAVDEIVPIDRARVFSCGFSNGGFMSYRLACEASDVFAAVAVVSAVLANRPNLAMGSSQSFSCSPPRPVPVLHIHGTKDELVTYTGNPLFGWPPVTECVRAWAGRNNGGKLSQPAVSFSNRSAATNHSVSCASYGGGMTNVTQCTITGGTHAWPGGKCGGSLGPCTLAIPGYATLHLAGEPLIDASLEIWRFFESKRMPALPLAAAETASGHT
jgi:polyhydroxybutyrate depolymerase